MADQSGAGWCVCSWTACAMGTVALIALVKMRLKRSKKKKVEQLPWPTIEPKDLADETTGVMHGLRVVEMGSILAVPSCTRALGDLGAEVIKVEANAGDTHRNYFPGERRKRHCGSMYEITGAGKACVKIDVTKNRADLIAMLKDADVLVVNVRGFQLEKLGLRYEDIKDELPHLVYAHLSAWGNVGPDADLPGYDIGSFYAASGISAEMQGPWTYARYPVAFGDMSTGAGLLGGIMAALSQKLITGHGCYVDQSLFRTGIYCNAPAILNVKNAAKIKATYRTYDLPVPHYEPEKVERKMLESAYFLADGSNIALAGEMCNSRALQALAQELKIDFSQLSLDTIAEKLKDLTFTEASHLLDKVEIPHVKRTMMSDLAINKTKQANHENAFYALDGMGSDLKEMLAYPLDFNGIVPKPRFAAQEMGAHTESWEKHGWSKRTGPADMGQRKNKNIHVLELSEFETSSVAGATKLFSELFHSKGHTVTKFSSQEDNPLQRQFQSFWQHIDKGKNLITYSNNDLQVVKDSVIKEVQKSDQITVFATNFPKSKLKDFGLDFESMSERYPSLVYVFVTPLGLQGPENIRNEIAAWYFNSSMSSLLSPGGLPSRNLPYQLGHLITSLFVFAALTGAVFHSVRTNAGKFVHVAMNRVGSWCNSCVFPLYLTGNPKQLEAPMIGRDGRDWWEANYPGFQSYKTKDGAWIMGLLHPAPQLPKWLKAFGMLGEGVVKFLGMFIYSKFTMDGSLLMHVIAGLSRWSQLFQREIGKMTLKEWTKFAASKDLWWAPIVHAESVLANVQARECGAISSDGAALSINCPVQIR